VNSKEVVEDGPTVVVVGAVVVGEGSCRFHRPAPARAVEERSMGARSVHFMAT
jgi:hypothetical protein